MRAISKRLDLKSAKRFSAFLLSNIVQKSGQLILLAGLTYIGTAQDVYRFGLFVSIFNIIVPILTANIHTSIGRISFNISDLRERRNFILTCLITGLASMFIGLAVLGMILKYIGFEDEITHGSPAGYFIISLTMMIFVMFQFFTVLLRLEERAKPFAVFGMIIGVGALGIPAITFFLGVPPFVAAAAGYSGAQLVASLYGFLSTRAVFAKAIPALRHLRAAYTYSAGTAIFAVVQWITNYSGRWLAGDWLDRGDLAAYTLLGQAIVALAMFLTTLYESQRPAIIRDFAAGDVQSGIRQINGSFKLTLVCVAGGFFAVLIAFPFLPSIFPADYQFKLSWIASAFFQGIAYAISIRIYWLSVGINRTAYFAVAACVGAMVNMACALTLGPVIGVNGLFLAAAFGLLTQALIAHFFLRKLQLAPPRVSGNSNWQE